MCTCVDVGVRCPVERVGTLVQAPGDGVSGLVDAAVHIAGGVVNTAVHVASCLAGLGLVGGRAADLGVGPGQEATLCVGQVVLGLCRGAPCCVLVLVAAKKDPESKGKFVVLSV